MRQYALSDLRLRCQQRADKEGDGHIQTAEWNRLISEMYGELFSIVESTGMRHFEAVQTIAPTSQTPIPYAIPLPADHLATTLVERVIDSASGRRMRLKRLNAQARARYLGMTGDGRRYCLAGPNLEIYPSPATGTYVHTYMPQAPDLSLAIDATMVDLVQADGEGFLIWGVAVKALAKSESDTAVAMAEREAHRERFRDWCQMRSFHDSPTLFVDHGLGDSDVDDDDAWNPASFRWNPP